jgi:hypothetical protein
MSVRTDVCKVHHKCTYRCLQSPHYSQRLSMYAYIYIYTWYVCIYIHLFIYMYIHIYTYNASIIFICIDDCKVPTTVKDYLTAADVKLSTYNSAIPYVQDMCTKLNNQKIWCDGKTVSYVYTIYVYMSLYV